MKLWEKSADKKDSVIKKMVEEFTAGKDQSLDLRIAKHDVLGSMAHAKMLAEQEIISKEDGKNLHQGLKEIHNLILNGDFIIEPGVEDVHSQVEMMLTLKYGESGKKIHTARSRNDQVLTDLKLFMREELLIISEKINSLFKVLIRKAEENKEVALPGYTHLQIAMPSTFGLWFSAYAEAFSDDLLQLQAALSLANKNPLGSAAGYGSAFPIKRKTTTELLGFEDMHYNVVYAQMTRGKSEKTVCQAIAAVAHTLSRFTSDCTLFMSQNFGFISLSSEFTTGSSIMPHKKNPDVFELVRAKCNSLQAVPVELAFLTTNLPSGYYRDMQITKEPLFKSVDEIKACLDIITETTKSITVNRNILDDKKYINIYTVESINELVKKGVPFREAYKTVGLAVEAGTYDYAGTPDHTHEGSIGNLCLEEIENKFGRYYQSILQTKEKIDDAIKTLLQ